MMQNVSVWVFAMVAATSPAIAAPAAAPPHIVVVGYGSVRTDPDIANLAFTIRGEGATSDAAATELVRKRAAIADGLAKLLCPEATLNTGELSIKEAHDKACDREDYQPRLSTGACAVRGYVASLDASLRISPVKDAGTALSLATRLGASNTQISDYSLRYPSSARRQAEAAAIADAHARALGIAAASRSRLGALISVEDQEARRGGAAEIMVTARRRSDGEAPPPVVIDLKPVPIDTTATLTVTYAVE